MDLVFREETDPDGNGKEGTSIWKLESFRRLSKDFTSPSGEQWDAKAVGDFNGDGIGDLLLENNSSTGWGIATQIWKGVDNSNSTYPGQHHGEWEIINLGEQVIDPQ